MMASGWLLLSVGANQSAVVKVMLLPASTHPYTVQSTVYSPLYGNLGRGRGSCLNCDEEEGNI